MNEYRRLSEMAWPGAAVAFTAATLFVLPCLASDSPAEENEHQPLAATSSLSYWDEGEPRAFLAERTVLGLGYGRVSADVGYGRPFWQWFGLETTGQLTLDSLSAQTGIKAAWMVAEGMFTLRRTYSFVHRALPRKTQVSSDDLRRKGAPGAGYTAIDAGLWGCVPYGRWLGTWELAWVRPLTLNPNELVLEEIQRVVVGSGGVWSGKLGFNVALSERKRAFVGAMGEYLGMVGRHPGTVLRAGPAFWVGITEHTELGGALTWPLHGPDELGFMTGMYGAIGVQYQFASGEPRWHFP
jgi:hypothetical protein